MVNDLFEADLDKLMGPARLAFFTPIHHNPVLADRKATFLLGAAGLICTVLLMFSSRIEYLVESHSPWMTALMLTLLLPLIGLLLFCVWKSWQCFVTGVPPMPDCLAYFPHIARGPLADYQNAVQSLTHRDAIRAILHYNYSLSLQAAAKFRLVNRAFSYFQKALILWMLLLLIISIAN